MKLFNFIDERKKAERRRQKINDVKKLAIGSVIGALAGILFAPKSGKETRKDIADKTKEAAKATKQTIKDLEEKVKDEVKAKVSEMKDRKMFEIDIDKDVQIDEEKNEEIEGE